jgi:hypothetical protein
VDAKDVANLLQALAVTVAAIAAIYGINAWRRQLIGGKRAEVAEKALVAFYEARDVLQEARSPASFGNEGKTRPRQEGETEAQAGRLDALYAPAERLISQREFFMTLNASRYRFAAYFGSETAAPFLAVLRLRNRVLLAVRMLVTTDLARAPPDLVQQIRRWERDIWLVGDERDEITREIEQAVEQIETVCRPVLEERRDRWWHGYRQRGIAKWRELWGRVRR